MTYLVIYADGKVARDSGQPSLDYLQSIVGGYSEVTGLERGTEHAILWMAEEGQRLGLPVNPTATMLVRQWGHAAVARPGILGNVVITGPADDEGETESLSPDWLAYLLDLPVARHREPA